MKHYFPEITDQQKKNLLTLANGLLDVQFACGFSMYDFMLTSGEHLAIRVSLLCNAEDLKPLYDECGTVACAVGHGPALGIKPKDCEDWDEYSWNNFINIWEDDEHLPVEDQELAWSWCFGSDWTDVDDTKEGAAYRILYMLKHGVPEDFYILNGKEFLEAYQAPEFKSEADKFRKAESPTV